MKMNYRNILTVIITSVLFIACNNGPKVITEQTNAEETETSSGIFSDENTNTEQQIRLALPLLKVCIQWLLMKSCLLQNMYI